MLLHSSDFHCEVSPEICDKVDIDWNTRKNKDPSLSLSLFNAAAVRHCHVSSKDNAISLLLGCGIWHLYRDLLEGFQLFGTLVDQPVTLGCVRTLAWCRRC